MINYPYLPTGRKILYMSEANVFMKEAKKMAQNYSTNKSQPTGAVVVKSEEIIGVGSNQSFFKNSKLQNWHKKGLCPRRFLKVRTGTKYWLCPGCGGRKSHAEAQAVSNALKAEKSLVGASLYLWGHWWCCKPCWDKMAAAGIENVYLLLGSEKLFNASCPDNILGKQF